MPSLKLLMLGFAAGFIATLIFHQGLWYIFNQVGVIPLDRPAWAMDSTPPFEIPAVLSKAFWGGLWGLVLTSILMHLDGMSYWAAWIVLGAVALTAVAFFVVPPLKGQPIPALWPRFFVGLALNGAWGFGTALLLRLVGAIRT
ncbi:MAG: hypothetical protein KBT60_06125 [Methyloceanibacter sp.]|jgi:hypothetical protein|nr:hypothetical protein [Methyloceanibacter sp.]